MNDNLMPHSPRVKGSNLNGETFYFPNDLKGILNIVVIPFRRDQTALLEEWTTSLEDFVAEYPIVAYYELPVLSVSYSAFRWWIDSGMSAGKVDDKARLDVIS
jgi:hypothetical protein